jgi:hypothetical protein
MVISSQLFITRTLAIAILGNHLDRSKVRAIMNLKEACGSFWPGLRWGNDVMTHVWDKFDMMDAILNDENVLDCLSEHIWDGVVLANQEIVANFNRNDLENWQSMINRLIEPTIGEVEDAN